MEKWQDIRHCHRLRLWDRLAQSQLEGLPSAGPWAVTNAQACAQLERGNAYGFGPPSEDGDAVPDP